MPKKIVVILLILLSLSPAESQVKMIEGDTQREEIQRYFGYEILPFRYISLPYDVSVNTNERALFVDIGYMYLAFLPLLVLLVFYDSKWRYYLFSALLMLMFVVATTNSFVFSFSQQALGPDQDSYASYLLSDVGFLEEFSANVSAYVYYIMHFVYAPIYSIIENISGDADIITYPLLVALFIMLVWTIKDRLKERSKEVQVISMIFTSFFFFWLKYSAGIIWYGFPLLIIAIMLIVKLFDGGILKENIPFKTLKFLFLTTSSIWVLSTMLLRMGQVQDNNPEPDLGKGMYSPTFYKYQCGELSSNQVLNDLYQGGFENALAMINSEEESYILRIGTSFTYFIRQNGKRVILDNQLGIFENIFSRYREEADITKALSASNIKYIIVDLNTPYLDKTPEKTLEKKYYRLMYYLKRAEGIRLLCTNRVIASLSPNGEQELRYGMFGVDEYKGKDIYYGGQYAIYQVF